MARAGTRPGTIIPFRRRRAPAEALCAALTTATVAGITLAFLPALCTLAAARGSAKG